MAQPTSDAALQPLITALVQGCADPDNDPATCLRLLRSAIEVSGVGAQRRTIGLLGLEGCRLIFSTLPSELTMPFFAQILRDDESNLRRHQLICRLRDLGIDAVAPGWRQTQEEIALRSLASVDGDDIPWLLEILLSSGADSFVDLIIPQLHAHHLTQYLWVVLIHAIRENKAKISRHAVNRVVSRCLEVVVHDLPAFPEPTTCYPEGENTSGEENVLKVLRLCQETNNIGHCSPVYVKMRQVVRRESGNRTFKTLYIALAPFAMEIVKSENPSAQFYIETHKEVLGDALNSITHISKAQCNCSTSWSSSRRNRDDLSCPLNERDTSTILLIANTLGGVENLRHIPGLKADSLKKHGHETVKNFIRAVAANFKPQQATNAYEVYDSAISALIAGIEDQSPSLTKNISFSQLCIDVGAFTAFKTLLVSLRKNASTLDLLVPLLPELAKLVQTESVRPALGSAFEAFARSTLKSFATKLKHFRLSTFDGLQTFGCQTVDACEHGCREMREFLLGNRSECDIPRKSESRKHLQQKLESLPAYRSLVSWTTLEDSNPYVLHV
ncbi:hypothetical protein C8F01DRAFT_1259353 [Mycena amicta]|nr:hypothetical protein C8F01DRAFT_1259353 [Mycena amicta]